MPLAGPLELLTIGPLISLTTNQAYALPARACRIQVDPDTATLTVSVDNSAYDTLTLTNGSALLGGRFIKSATASTQVVLTAI